MLRPEESCRPRIAIDLHVVDGIFQGSRAHCLDLFSRVIGLMPGCDFFLLANDSRTLKSHHENFSLSNVTILPLRSGSAIGRLIFDLPRLVTRLNVGLLHTQYIAPPLVSCASAVTVHDILFESHPEYFRKFFVLRSRVLVPFSIRRSRAVFTVSKFSQEEICSRYAVPPESISVIPNGVDSGRFCPGEGGIDTVRDLGLTPGGYFLTVGRLEPRKNHDALFRAWAKLPNPRPKLAVVGQRHFKYSGALELIRNLRLEGDLILLETVSDDQLPALYRHSSAFIYPSWAEGFGMPVLEAMSSGIPVITSSTTALAEVSGNAALQVHPGDWSALAECVQALSGDIGLRESLIARGFDRARDFTWERSAATVRDVYMRYFQSNTAATREVDTMSA
jgi:glycosyltransferase involved in cell wall biosynthesis